MLHSKTTKTCILLMLSLLFIGLSVNQAKADVKINIGLGYPLGYVHHSPGYSVHYYAPKYHHHSNHKHYSKHKHHKSHHKHGHHKKHYHHNSRGHHRGHKHNHRH